MRTQQEILDKIESVKDSDFFGMLRGFLMEYLDRDHIVPFLAEGVKPEEWEPASQDREAILKEMLDYMPFAWEKANDCRGISAGRSMDHYTAWVWMLGDDDKLGELRDYQFYGKTNLIKICVRYGWDHTKWDDGVRTNG